MNACVDDRRQDAGFRAVFGPGRFGLSPGSARDRRTGQRGHNLALLLSMFAGKYGPPAPETVGILDGQSLIAGVCSRTLGSWITASFRDLEDLTDCILDLKASGRERPGSRRHSVPTFALDLDEDRPSILLLHWPTIAQMQAGANVGTAPTGLRLDATLTAERIRAAHQQPPAIG